MKLRELIEILNGSELQDGEVSVRHFMKRGNEIVNSPVIVVQQGNDIQFFNLEWYYEIK